MIDIRKLPVSCLSGDVSTMLDEINNKLIGINNKEIKRNKKKRNISVCNMLPVKSDFKINWFLQS